MKNDVDEYAILARRERLLCRAVFGLILIDLVFSATSSTLIHQLQQPVLKYAYVDPTYWIMHLLNVPEWVSQNRCIGWFWDMVLFTSCTAVLFYPGKRWLILVFIAFYFVYYIIFNSFGDHHTHSLIPVLIAPVAFLFTGKSFSFAWKGLRYFLLFAYSAAFFWKLCRFSWVAGNQGILIMKMNLTPYLYYHPQTFLASTYWWMFQHPFFPEALFVAGWLLEGVCLIGFFTNKYDRFLLIVSLLLPLGFWYFADAVFFEMTILSLSLLPPSWIDRLALEIPALPGKLRQIVLPPSGN